MLNSSNQQQQAGDFSKQFQNCPITVNLGIDEKRAREIFKEQFSLIKNEFTNEANVKAEQRYKQFEDIFIPKLMANEKRLKALSEPSFQFLLRDANRKAVCTDNKNDYELLSELLIHKSEHIYDYNKSPGIKVAIDIVDQIDNLTLHGLTMAYAVSDINPITWSIHDGLEVINELYKNLITNDLPVDNNWLDNLDLLKCIRLSDFGNLKKYWEYFVEKYDGYFCYGIQSNSDKYLKANEIIEQNQLPKDILCKHEIFEDRVRLPIKSKNEIDKLGIVSTVFKDGKIEKIRKEFSKKQIDAIYEIFKLCCTENNKNELIEAAKKFSSQFSSIHEVSTWWDKINRSFNITLAGKALAHANAKRLYPLFPDFNN